METLNNVFNSFFSLLCNVGTISNKDIVKMTILSLIDDYGQEIISCNGSYKRQLEDIVYDFTGSSCLFGYGNQNGNRYVIGGNGGSGYIPSGCMINNDGKYEEAESITNDEIDSLFN